MHANNKTAAANMQATFRMNISVALIMELISFLSFRDKGEYNAALVTPDMLVLTSTIQLRNWVIDEVIPLYPDPNALNISFGTINPHMAAINSYKIPVTVLIKAFLLRTDIPPVY